MAVSAVKGKSFKMIIIDDIFAEYAEQLPPYKSKNYQDVNCIVCNALNTIIENRIDQGRCRICWHPLPPNLHLKSISNE